MGAVTMADRQVLASQEPFPPEAKSRRYRSQKDSLPDQGGLTVYMGHSQSPAASVVDKIVAVEAL